MDQQETPQTEVDERPVIARIMGHELRAVGLFNCISMAAIAWLVVIPWSFFVGTRPAPEIVASALLAMIVHEAGISLTKISGWVILLGVLVISRPFFAWIITIIGAPGTTPAS